MHLDYRSEATRIGEVIGQIVILEIRFKVEDIENVEKFQELNIYA